MCRSNPVWKNCTDLAQVVLALGIWFSGFVMADAGLTGGTWEMRRPRHLHCADGGRGSVSGA